MEKMITFPTSLIGLDTPQNTLELDGCTLLSNVYIVHDVSRTSFTS